MGRLFTVRRDRFEGVGGLRSQYDGAHLHDLALRLADAPLRVHRIPRVLYHSSRSAADPAATARAISDAIARREEVTAECVPGPGRATFLLRRRVACGDTTAIVCSRSAKLVGNCIASVRATAGKAVSRIVVVAHEEAGPDGPLRDAIQRAGATAVSFSGVFNFAAMNNLGAQVAESGNLLFLNDDIEATAPGWAELLNEQLARNEVGVAGAVLRYPSGALQHAGIVAGIGDGVGHIGRHAHSSDLWPWLLATRNVSAVTGACLAIRKEVFQQLDGFDTRFPNNYNDVDLCFRVRERGLAVVCVPAPGLVHRECQSRRGIVRFEERFAFYRRWGTFLAQPVPF
jgi:GT2 family glycosyltransferase